MLKSCIPIFLVCGCLLFAGYACNFSGSRTEDGRAEYASADSVSYNFDIRPILSDKCYACHGPDANKREADLRLDVEAVAYAALKDNPHMHALVPGKPGESEVYLRITATDTSLLMPPPASGLTLSQDQVALIRKWIKQGAKYEPHWSFVPPKDQALPGIRDKAWPVNEIDYFTLSRMEQNGLSPNPESDKERLLKRVCLDLTGLPPSLELMERFLNDKDPGAYEKIVDHLLKQPSYGEHMALHWLDVARYADSHGYQDDNYRSQWPWRDWVIHAFNENYSYDKFATMQIAGDLMPGSDKEDLLATGFNRNHKITEEGGAIDEEYRVEYVTDRTNTFGKAFLGVTIECAHCHDHKYDPFSQKEYYQLFSFFNNVKEEGLQSSVGGPETWAKRPLMQISNEDVQNALSFINKPDTNKLIVSVMGDLDSTRKTYVLKRGAYDVHGDEVGAGTPKAILPFSDQYTKDRMGLAKWLFDPKNPLTSRVFVNQMWQEVFGRGIVKTAGDFGMQGELPSHPKLLDWLAHDFMTNGWNIKRLMKQMVLSATYRQSSVISPEKLKADPENILLSRATRHRVNAETVRDLVLASSGLLNRTIGGPSVKPYQPPGLWEGATSGKGLLANYKQDHGQKLYRRGIYTFVKRTVPPPSMAIFDASSRDVCEVTRLTTNTPLQALVMMNNPVVMEASRVLSAKLLEENSPLEDKISKGFRLIVCRKPKATEIKLLANYYNDLMGSLNLETAKKILSAGEYPQPQRVDKIANAAMTYVISTIYNLEESITKS